MRPAVAGMTLPRNFNDEPAFGLRVGPIFIVIDADATCTGATVSVGTGTVGTGVAGTAIGAPGTA